MATGKSVVSTVAEHLAKVLQRPNQREREDILMAIADHLAAAIDKIVTRETDLETQNDALMAENATLKAAPVATGGISEERALALIAKIEAIVGPVADPSTSAPAPVVGSTSTTVTDPTAGTTTTVDHSTGAATTTNASGAPIATDAAAAQAATAAATAAGVTVPTA